MPVEAFVMQPIWPHARLSTSLMRSSVEWSASSVAHLNPAGGEGSRRGGAN